MQKQRQIKMRYPDPDDVVGNNGRRSKLEGYLFPYMKFMLPGESFQILRNRPTATSRCQESYLQRKCTKKLVL
jgi:hypothetical protein